MSDIYREMMSKPGTWPFLPVRKLHCEQIGFMIAMKGKLTTVFLTNFWSVATKEIELKVALEGDKIEYNSLDELLEDGWIVD